MCCLVCIGVCSPFLHHLFLGTWLTSGKPQGEVVWSWFMVNTQKRACSPSLHLWGSRNLLVPSFTTINKHHNHPWKSCLSCNQVRNVSLSCPKSSASSNLRDVSEGVSRYRRCSRNGFSLPSEPKLPLVHMFNVQAFTGAIVFPGYLVSFKCPPLPIVTPQQRDGS